MIVYQALLVSTTSGAPLVRTVRQGGDIVTRTDDFQDENVGAIFSSAAAQVCANACVQALHAAA